MVIVIVPAGVARMTLRAKFRRYLAALFLSAISVDVAGQQAPVLTDRWIATHVTQPGVVNVGMRYLTGNQGSPYEPVLDMLVARCVRQPDGPSQWEFFVSRTGRSTGFFFDGSERLSSWWQVGGEPAHGPMHVLGYHARATVYDDALTARLREPVGDSLKFRIIEGNREWNFGFGPEGFAEAVAEFDASCSP
jgi:hypothetical protein